MSALAMLATACSSEVDEPVNGDNDNSLKVTATIDQIKSRASETEWAVGDKIGVTGGTYSNVPFTATSTSGTFTSDTKVLLGDESVSFTAYYPYAESTSDEITFNVVDENYAPVSLPSIDFLFAPAVTANRNNTKVNFMFAHKMSKLNLTINDGSKILDESYSISYTLSSIATTGTFNTATGLITPGMAEGFIKQNATLGDASVAIVPSYSEANTTPVSISIVVAKDGKEEAYTGTFTPALLAGTQYNYTFDLKYGGEATVSSESITGWTNSDTQDVPVTPGGDTPTPPHKTVVGDYLLDDGSVLAKEDMTDENKANIVGVVYYVGNDLSTFNFPKNNGLALAINNNGDASRFEANKSNFITWATDNSASLPTGIITTDFNITNGANSTSYLGYNNSLVLKAAYDATKETETIYADNIGARLVATTPVNSSDWYLPSFAEFKTITENLSTINASLSAVGGTELVPLDDYDRATTTTGFYWTSTLRGTQNAWVSVLNSNVDESTLYLTRVSNGTTGMFRFAVAF